MSVGLVFARSDNRARWTAVVRHYKVKASALPLHAAVYLVVNGDAQGAIELPRFVHPENANYIFGPDFGVAGQRIIPPEALRVTIPGACELYAAQAAAIVLYDRHMKTEGVCLSQIAS